MQTIQAVWLYHISGYMHEAIPKISSVNFHLRAAGSHFSCMRLRWLENNRPLQTVMVPDVSLSHYLGRILRWMSQETFHTCILLSCAKALQAQHRDWTGVSTTFADQNHGRLGVERSSRCPCDSVHASLRTISTDCQDHGSNRLTWLHEFRKTTCLTWLCICRTICLWHDCVNVTRVTQLRAWRDNVNVTQVRV